MSPTYPQRPFVDAPIADVLIRPLKRFLDSRGWLCEVFRQDELDPAIFPAMAYVSLTKPGTVRGPHEHRDQADYFAFVGPSEFLITLWDNRPASATYWHKVATRAHADHPTVIVVPPGVVHAYQNVGASDGMVFNAPNRLYAGAGRKHAVDEIRHEGEADDPFRL